LIWAEVRLPHFVKPPVRNLDGCDHALRDEYSSRIQLHWIALPSALFLHGRRNQHPGSYGALFSPQWGAS